MSFSWRYVVRPDGSFSRMGNVDGSLDNYSDVDLARLDAARSTDKGEEEEKPARPSCSRCGGDVLLDWHGPWGTGVWMELCPACDADRPAARAFIRWHRDPDRDPKVLQRLFEDWETETMHAQGWSRAAEPEAPPAPPVHPRLVPRGQG
ncbi:DUF6300 family protein [Streptomyces phaeochromogenes]|uniref:DUF6300 family protein n=1 Tax=Streptomyces phaeochromogenes TaxID=1923 RepID=A0ABZ1HT49_STRPH|nr:DUF6300 family protein [Streptomyces phaeochromogenes]WSD21219.1 DUF6300 family protein [Streptomyces phaeochromogenes]